MHAQERQKCGLSIPCSTAGGSSKSSKRSHVSQKNPLTFSRGENCGYFSPILIFSAIILGKYGKCLVNMEIFWSVVGDYVRYYVMSYVNNIIILYENVARNEAE